MQILGIDVGGSGIKAALVETADGSLLTERIRIETPRPATPQSVGKALQGLVRQMDWKGPVGLGFPAAIQHGIARTAANIDKSFIGLPVADYFSEQTGCEVYAANDADAAGLAEMRFGAGQGVPGVVLIVTIGTGLGTALFTDGHLLPNAELGHVLLDNGREAERYASEAVRVAKKAQVEGMGQAPRSLPGNPGAPALARPDGAGRRGEQEAGEVRADDQRAHAGGGREIPQPGRRRRRGAVRRIAHPPVRLTPTGAGLRRGGRRPRPKPRAAPPGCA